MKAFRSCYAFKPAKTEKVRLFYCIMVILRYVPRIPDQAGPRKKIGLQNVPAGKLLPPGMKPQV